ncbi:MAG: S1 RNA-binding domain-containing protein [Clostridia bacterium]|nr:S1 RNA-binding domain-containing protein [Clostridia bacterium]
MQFEVGMIFEGKVSGITEYGAFVDLPENKSGMVHISEVSYDFVKNINDYVKEGQIVKVKLIGISDIGKISLSMKQAEARETHKKRSFNKPDNGAGNADRKNTKHFEKKTNNFQNTNKFQPKPQKSEPLSFEDMLSKFKQSSDERISDLKKSTEAKRGRSSRRNAGPR